ncbi:MAG TPA: hypothetical protein VK942_09560 [Actinomycetes bacterium]|jgi:hypothetical protein|nr:hypothetical protein [Actinomycetes bacterium]
MRHAVVTTRLFQQARAAADAEADERLERLVRAEDRMQAEDRDQAAPEPRRLVTTLARRARALAARTT